MQSSGLGGVSHALAAGFHVYARADKKLAPLHGKIAPDTFDIVDAAFAELASFSPGPFMTWWATHHNRFIRRHRQRDISLVHELMYHYLTAVARGRIEIVLPESDSDDAGDRGTGAGDGVGVSSEAA